MKKIKNKNIRTVIDYVIITLGILIASYALETILIPNTILDGGITGISIIISKITPLAISNLIFVLNIPFIIIGYKNMGKNFLIKAIYSMVIYSIFLSLFSSLPPLTNQILLATVYGGLMLGLGTGLVIRFGGCLDGTESVAIVISKKHTISVGQIILIFNLLPHPVKSISSKIILNVLITFFNVINFKTLSSINFNIILNTFTYYIINI